MRKALIAAVVAVVAGACTNITLVSVSSNETQGNADSAGRPALSTSGQFVAFTSSASNLVANDTNAKQDVFVRDTANGTTERVSLTQSNGQANGDSTDPSISDNGRYVAFSSTATNIWPNDTNNKSDVFARDRTLAVTALVSHDSAGHPANGESFSMGISADGSKLLFISNATNLAGLPTTSTHFQLYLADFAKLKILRIATAPVCGSENQLGGIFEATMNADATKFAYAMACKEIISTSIHIVAKSGSSSTELENTGDCEQSDVFCDLVALQYSRDGSTLAWLIHREGHSFEEGTVSVWAGSGSPQQVRDPDSGFQMTARDIALSPTGRYLAFTTLSFLPTTGPDNDLRILDRTANTTSDVSVATDGSTSTALEAAFSPDGTQIGFTSGAANLVPNDTNGKIDVFMRPVSASAAATAVSRGGSTGA